MRGGATADLAQSKALLNQRLQQLDLQAKYEELIQRPAHSLTREFLIKNFWERLPENFKEEKRQKITTWVKRAEDGDQVAQAVLLTAQNLLKEKGVKTEALPSFEWKEPASNSPVK